MPAAVLPVMATLREKADFLERELGLDPGLSIVETIGRAASELGIQEEVASLPLLQRAEACVAQTEGSPALPSAPKAVASLGSAGEQWRHPSLVVPAVASLVPSAAVAVPFATLVGGGALYNLEPSHRTWHEHDQLARSQGCTVAPDTNPEELEAVMRAAGGLTVWIGGNRHGRGNGPGAIGEPAQGSRTQLTPSPPTHTDLANLCALKQFQWSAPAALCSPAPGAGSCQTNHAL